MWQRWLGVVVCGLSCACDGAPPPARNVVLVVADTLRADHLGCYGYTRDVSPRLDRFAASATRYPNAVSSSPWTLPSHASLFTGLDPWEHGAHLLPVKGPGPNARSLAEAHLTLAEALRAEGFRTAGFVANTAFLAHGSHLEQGFETWALRREPAARKGAAISAWLDENGSEPFFLFVNYMDTHQPYNASGNRPGLDPPPLADPLLLSRLIQAVLPGLEPAPPGLVRQVVDQYDAAVANVDAAIGGLLDALRARGRLDDSLVIVTSDHGEFFGEHGLVEHSKDVYQPVLAVPLLVRHPGQTRGRLDASRISSAQVPHLVVSALTPEIAQRLLPAFPRAAGSAWVVAESHFGHAKDAGHPIWGWRFRRARRALFDGPYKFIFSSDGAHELYDLSSDADEQRNLVEQEPVRVARYLRFFDERPPDRRRPADFPSDAAAARELRTLGYVE